MAKRSRKSVDVAWIKERIQYAITHSDYFDEPLTYHPSGKRTTCTPAEAARLALAGVMNDLLHETGNYRGFNYDAWINGGYRQWMDDGQPKRDYPDPYLGDQTKVTYY